MRITVSETIEHSAEITAAHVRAYLKRRGAKLFDESTTAVCNGKPNPFEVWGFEGPHGPAVVFGDRDFGDLACGSNVVRRVAMMERRPAHEVLADIAREP